MTMAITSNGQLVDTKEEFRRERLHAKLIIEKFRDGKRQEQIANQFDGSIRGLVVRGIGVLRRGVWAVTGRAPEMGSAVGASAASGLKTLLDSHPINGTHFPRL